MMQLTSQVKKSELQTSQENVFGKTFKKEAMRIFVEDCLYDGLEEGITLLSKQGRLWKDQPGGTISFVEGQNGISVDSGDRVYYGITRKEYLPEQNAYPCPNQSNSPLFCNYFYPAAQAKFGELALRQSSIVSDLRRYLENKTKECVLNYTLTNVSSAAVLEQTTMDLTMDLQNEGITVNVIYPLKFKVAGEEFFHLTTFDFFYPTRFKQLLDSAVTTPLQWDQEYLDFNYTEQQLQQEEFQYGTNLDFPNCPNGFCTLRTKSRVYSSLGITMIPTSLSWGDDIFTFTPAVDQIIHSPEPYYFRIARQNRPPALDLVNRSQCNNSGYDYLVIKDEPEPLGGIDFVASALDPDEDGVIYSFDYGSLSVALPIVNNHFTIDPTTLSTVTKGFYNITVTATDDHGLTDKQDVRVLIDRPQKLEVSLSLPYADTPSTTNPGYYFVSKEDPVFMTITYPEQSLDQSVPPLQKVSLEYSNEEGTESFAPPLELPRSYLLSSNTGCFSLPGAPSLGCDLSSYSTSQIVKDWQDLLTGEFGYFKSKTSTGKLTLSYGAKYCATFDQSNSAEANIIVKDCVAHRNDINPFAAPYHDRKKITTGGTITWSQDATANPLTANHSCCNGNPNIPTSWRLAPTTQKCFSNPYTDCYDSDYLLQEEFVLCDGQRGNYCSGPEQYALWDRKMICGSSSYLGCDPIPTNCENNPAFSLVNTDADPEYEGWCHGTEGCQSWCALPKVLSTSDSTARIGSRVGDLNSIALVNNFDKDDDLKVECGCSGANVCDSDWDGEYDGTCVNGVCTQPQCSLSTSQPIPCAADTYSSNYCSNTDHNVYHDLIHLSCSPDASGGGTCEAENTLQPVDTCPYGCTNGVCDSPVCGDEDKEGTEECDDGNNDDNDGCDNNCQRTICGDGTIQSPNNADQYEDCEGTSTQSCTINGYAGTKQCNSCTLGSCTTTERCGDSVRTGPEQCDGSPQSCTVGSDSGTKQCTDCTLGLCVICTPDTKRCSSSDAYRNVPGVFSAIEICSADGTRWERQACSSSGSTASSSPTGAFTYITQVCYTNTFCDVLNREYPGRFECKAICLSVCGLDDPNCKDCIPTNQCTPILNT